MLIIIIRQKSRVLEDLMMGISGTDLTFHDKSKFVKNFKIWGHASPSPQNEMHIYGKQPIEILRLLLSVRVHFKRQCPSSKGPPDAHLIHESKLYMPGTFRNRNRLTSISSDEIIVLSPQI